MELSHVRCQVALLKEHYRCVAFDFRGQGQSEVTRGGYDKELGSHACQVGMLGDKQRSIIFTPDLFIRERG